MIIIKNYQEKAINNIYNKIIPLLNNNKYNNLIILQSPTGSGKTFIIFNVLNNLTKNNIKFCTIWVSVRMLHEQSKEKLENYNKYEKQLICSYFEDIKDKQLKEKEILFLNWHSINQKDKNVYIRDSEDENNLINIINNTKKKNIPIILIIDESHHTASSENSKDLINLIQPNIILSVSATPKLVKTKDNIDIIKVDIEDVKKEQMIKKNIKLNENYVDLVNENTLDETVIDSGLKKREKLVELYKEEGSNVNPLLLIQLPDKKGIMDDKLKEVINYLKKYDITEENGKLAIWLSEKKTNNLEFIEKNDDKTEVLIFKQSISLGWDCPRAQVLVIFREMNNFVFTIQTIGRTMRMPEYKYYKNDELNNAYIYTNLSNIKIDKYIEDYVVIYEAKRKENYKPINLISYYKETEIEKFINLDKNFYKQFYNEFKNNNEIKLLNFDTNNIEYNIIVNKVIENLDEEEIELKANKKIVLNNLDLQKFYNILISNIFSFFDKERIFLIKKVIKDFFKKELNISTNYIEIILNSKNINLFKKILTDVKNSFIKKQDFIKKCEWEIPENIYYSKNYKHLDCKKSIMHPFYIEKDASEIEKKFIDFLENCNNIDWWFKNGDNGKDYFAIPYIKNNETHLFYADFIVKFKDGTIGLYDTKDGKTLEDSKERSEYLQKYIKNCNNIKGGIIRIVNDVFYINNNEIFSLDMKEWKLLRENNMYENYTKEELINEILQLKQQKKYGIVWEDKPENIVQFYNENIPFLKLKNKIFFDFNKTFHTLIEGENYYALKILEDIYKDKIDIIYIDPPYNTGNNDFIYNDDYIDNNDGYRHSKWLFFMEKRLKLARKLLSKNGIIFISIGSEELAQLKLLCDEIFRQENFIEYICIKKKNPAGVGQNGIFVNTTEYVICYAKDKKQLNKIKEINYKEEEITKKTMQQYSYIFKNKGEREFIKEINISNKKIKIFKMKNYIIEKIKKDDFNIDFYIENFNNIFRTTNNQSNLIRQLFKILEDKELYEIEYSNKDNKIKIEQIYKKELVIYLNKVTKIENDTIIKKEKMTNFWDDISYASLDPEDGIKFNNGKKPLDLIKRLISLVPDNKNAIILDFFAGSGTTGQAVYEMNKEDNGNRKFILVTNSENNICEEKCFKRLQNVIKDENVNYYKIDFIKRKSLLNEKDLENFIETFKIYENCYKEEINKEFIKIYSNQDKYVIFLTNEDFIDEIIEFIKNGDKKVMIYFYSDCMIDNVVPTFLFDEVKEKIINIYPFIINF